MLASLTASLSAVTKQTRPNILCVTSRYKRRHDGGDDNMSPQKAAWYFPIVPLLEYVRAPADCTQWQNFDRKYGKFAEHSRNIQFAAREAASKGYREGRCCWVWLCEQQKVLPRTAKSAKKMPPCTANSQLEKHENVDLAAAISSKKAAAS